MNTLVLTAALTLGQVPAYCPPGYALPPIVYAPPAAYYTPPAVQERLEVVTNEAVTSRFNVPARFADYNNHEESLPVINGYLPEVTVHTVNGKVTRIVADYRTKRYPYDATFAAARTIVYRLPRPPQVFEERDPAPAPVLRSAQPSSAEPAADPKPDDRDRRIEQLMEQLRDRDFQLRRTQGEIDRLKAPPPAPDSGPTRRPSEVPGRQGFPRYDR